MNWDRGSGMIPEHVDKKLKMFRKETFAVLEEKEQIEIGEKKKEGEVKLVFTAQERALIFKSPEKGNAAMPILIQFDFLM